MSKVPAWLWRKIIYLVVFAAAVVAGARGWIDAGDIDGLADQWAEILTAAVSLLAASKTHEGSDDKATSSEVATSVDALNAVREVVTSLPDSVVQAIRAEERGEYPSADSQSVGDYYRR
ncbi:hypothetical protein [Corynebacterium provencense]|uniref:hypothetical protein n=1 Tax=Corynebacterium provencense TaxID=1737425 RepID=UPI00082F782A|nr:hypothetical protein [Corynebacterium provencense]